jgi:hypothetical protein
MSISSVVPTLVVKAPDPIQWKAPDVKDPSDPEMRAAQPTVKAPLPPGQGTRVDQLA